MVAAAERAVRMSDGRRLAYLDLGDPGGFPVVHAHGAPSGKAETVFFDLDDAALQAGVRLLAPDRPGVGGSDPHPGRTLLDWPADVTGLADALGLASFGLLGYSAGAASALACLHRPDDRLTAVAIASGIGPPDVPGLDVGRAPDVARAFRWAATRPRASAAMLRIMRLGTRNPDRMIAAASKHLPPADREVAARPDAARAFASFIADALRQGPAGVGEDLRLPALPWGFVPTDAAIPLHIWHGTADRNAPVQAARWLAEQLPHSSLTILPDEGHISLLLHHAGSVLGALKP